MIQKFITWILLITFTSCTRVFVTDENIYDSKDSTLKKDKTFGIVIDPLSTDKKLAKEIVLTCESLMKKLRINYIDNQTIQEIKSNNRKKIWDILPYAKSRLKKDINLDFLIVIYAGKGFFKGIKNDNNQKVYQ